MKSSEVLQTIANIMPVSEKSLPVKLSYAISVNLGRLQKVAEDIGTARRKLLEKYSELDEEGKPVIKNGHYQIKDGEMPDLQKEMDQLMEEENEIDIRKVDMAIIDQCDSPRCDMLSAKDIMAIDFMLNKE